MTERRRMVSVRSISDDEWTRWRAMRLSALAEAPEAFSLTLEQWSGPQDTERRWRERLVTVPFNLLAFLDGQPVGMASATAPASGEVELISMWVSPDARGKGVGDALIEEIAVWARRQGASRLVLAVRADNDPASALYARNGFVETGGSAHSDDRSAELDMVRILV